MPQAARQNDHERPVQSKSYFEAVLEASSTRPFWHHPAGSCSASAFEIACTCVSDDVLAVSAGHHSFDRIASMPVHEAKAPSFVGAIGLKHQCQRAAG